MQRRTHLEKLNVRFGRIVRLFYLIPIYFKQFLAEIFCWITWVISSVYELFPSFGTINKLFKYGNVIGYVNPMNVTVLNSKFITEFVMKWSIALPVFLVTRVGLFTVGIRPC